MDQVDQAISLVVITYNEEANIERCLKSAQSIVDELFVVDSFSDDQTVEIARSLGARVEQRPFSGYIEQKRYAISQAKFNRVLVLDADEALDEQLLKSVLHTKQNWTHDCYTMNRMSNLNDRWIRHGGWYPDKKMRLFDRRKYEVVGINPHDKFVSLADATQKHLKGDILHYTNSSFEDRIQTINKFSTVAAQAFYEKGKKGSWLRVLFKPGLRFLSEYVLRRGFLDGFYGFFIAKTSAQYVFYREVKLLELRRRKAESH